MKKLNGYILFLIFLNLAWAGSLSLAQPPVADTVVIERPDMEYKSSKFRDPFKTYLIKEEPKIVVQDDLPVTKPQFDTSKITIQGIVWGGARSQAIINNRVCTIGDTIEGAQILSIDKKGITLNYGGEIVSISSAAPGPVNEVKQ